MVTAIANPFDPHRLVQKLPPPRAVVKNVKRPYRPLLPSEAVRESKADGRDSHDTYGSDKYNDVSGGHNMPSEEDDVEKSSVRRGYGASRRGFRGGACRGGYYNGGDAATGERLQRVYDRHCGSAYGEFGKLVIEDDEKRKLQARPSRFVSNSREEPGVHENATKENPGKEPEEQKPEEEKEMTLEEYEILLEEKRKALLALKAKERKVVLDKDLETMQVLSSKKSEEEIFVKLGTDKDKRIKFDDKEERAKKSVHFPEYLKPAVPGGKYYNHGF